jgi:hypothetical protein
MRSNLEDRSYVAEAKPGAKTHAPLASPERRERSRRPARAPSSSPSRDPSGESEGEAWHAPQHPPPQRARYSKALHHAVVTDYPITVSDVDDGLTLALSDTRSSGAGSEATL